MKKRVVTGSIAAAGFITLLALGGYWFLAAILLIALIGYYEFIRLNRLKAGQGSSLLGFIALLCFVLPWDTKDFLFSLSFEAVLWLLMFLLFVAMVATKNQIHIGKGSLLFLGAVYIGLGFHYMIQVRWEYGLAWSLFIFMCIWLTDTGAYLSGRWLGKHLLWPAISPKKTIEGAIGGILFSIGAAVVFALLIRDFISIPYAVILAIVIAILSQIGDLIQSAYKRHASVKDSGNILPGHGGVLDRCDSWVIVFPFIYYFFLG